MEINLLFFYNSIIKLIRRTSIMNLLEVNHVKKVYTTRFGGNKVEALKSVTFSVEEGE